MRRRLLPVDTIPLGKNAHFAQFNDTIADTFRSRFQANRHVEGDIGANRYS
jgi:hypothetical protein